MTNKEPTRNEPGPTAISAEWARWLDCVSIGPDDQDLAEVFTRVRPQGTIATQMKWARRWETHTFCDLALHLLYEHHIRRAPAGRTDETMIFANLEPSKLAEHASAGGFFDHTEDAEQLNPDRLRGAWGNQPAFCQDFIAYLFRPAPYLRRLERLHPLLIDATKHLTLGEWIRHTAKTEMDSVLADPLVWLHKLFETNMPRRPEVQTYVLTLRRRRLDRWADLYQRVFTAYCAPVREDHDGQSGWLEMAERFSMIAGGAFNRAQTRPGEINAGPDGEMLAQSVIDMLPAMLDIGPSDIEERRINPGRADKAP